MNSRRAPQPLFRARRLTAYACAWILLGLSDGALAQMESAASDIETDPQHITQTDVDAAIAKVKADPNLLLERKVRALRWRGNDQDDKKKVRDKSNGWFGWLGDFFTFVAETGRVIVWLALGVALTLLGVLIFRLVREMGPRDHPLAFNAPTHVRDLDIRPESLPDNIGAAALDLWMRGERRAALALLYRGLLSRLVHVHEIPIHHSSTEGDCLALAQQRLSGASAEYATRLIRIWQRAVYGAQQPPVAEVESLCNGFATAMDTDTRPGQAERVA